MNELSIQKGIRDRWSTRAFDAERPVEQDKLRAIFEAFRWAPSSTNVQPWSIIAGINFDECHKKIFSTLREGNQIWAQNAPVLLITVANMIRNGRPNRFAFHDVGLASENLNLQAWELDLYCHFMGGFYPEKAKEVFEIPEEYEPVAVAAIGYIGDSKSLSEDLQKREMGPRERKPLDKFVFSGLWNVPLAI